MSARKLLLSGLGAVAVYAALSASALFFADGYGRAVLPFYRWELGWIAPEYEVLKLELDHSDPQPKVSITALETNDGSAGGQLQPQAIIAFRSFVLVMSGLQHVVLVFFVPLAWPGLTWRRRATAVMCAIPVLCAVEFVDIPWSLIGGLDAAKADMAHTSETLATTWRELLSTGGRLALGLAGGALACQAASVFKSTRPRKVRRRKPDTRLASR